jgi:hypothetical protein
MKKIILFFVKLLIQLLPIAYMGMIWLLSSYPSDAFVSTGWTYDRTFKEALHLVEFGILYLLVVLALLSWGKLNQKSNFHAAVFSFLYGLTDELHQYLVPSRSCSLLDLTKDLIGVTIAWYIMNRAYTVPNSKIKSLIEIIDKKLFNSCN